MKLNLWSVGKGHEDHVEEGILLFTKRIANYYPVKWQIIAPPKQAAAMNDIDLKKAEGILILNQLKKDDYLIVLDERGQQFTSENLASFIQQRANDSEKNIIFLIGGAFGVSNEVLERADFKWSLSQLVFPHQLVRMILAEQIYRACTIIKNEKYHHK